MTGKQDVVADHLHIAGRGRPAAAPATPSVRGTRVNSAGRSRSSSRPGRRSGSRADDTKMRCAASRHRGPARSRLRAAHTSTCADRQRPSRRASTRRRPAGAPGTCAARPPYAPSTWNHNPCSRQMAPISGSGSTAPVLTEPAVPTTMNGWWPRSQILLDLPAERDRIHPLTIVGRNQSDRVGAEPEEIRGLLDPGVRLGRGVNEQAVAAPRQPFFSHVPASLRRARGDEAHEVRHVAAAHEQAAGVGRKSDQLRDPPHRLRFDLGRERRQPPRTHVRIRVPRRENRRAFRSAPGSR